MNLYARPCFCLLVSCLISSVYAQPSGGPYGPIQQTYELPTTTGTIYYVAPDAKPDAAGLSLAQPTTLEQAIQKVITGDCIVMRGGTYRTGGLLLNQSITIQPYKDEQPILKGTLIAKDWQLRQNSLWTTSWEHLFPSKPADWWRRESNAINTPLHLFNDDMVFVDGKLLKSTGWPGEVDENSFFIDYEKGIIYLSIDPNDKLIEITAFDSAITRTIEECHGKTSDGKGPTIRGITFTQYARRAFEFEGFYPNGLSDESAHGNDIVGTTIENCAITYCSRVAGFFLGDNLIIRNCLISDTSTEGIYVVASDDILLEKNIFRRNNIEDIRGYFPAAVKIFNQCYRATCRDNLIIDHPYSNGIWYDVGEVDGRIVDNWFQNIRYPEPKPSDRGHVPSYNAFFFEISKGAVCAGNVFVDCDFGMFILNASDVKMYNNTCVNSPAYIERNTRSAVGDHFGWHPATGPDVDQRHGHVFVNNLLTADENFSETLLIFKQDKSLCARLDKTQVDRFDYNIYVRKGTSSKPLITWSPAQNANCQIDFNSLDAFRKYQSEFGANSRQFINYNGPLFKNAQLKDYGLLSEFTAAQNAAPVPSEISELLGRFSKEQYIGAFPIVR